MYEPDCGKKFLILIYKTFYISIHNNSKHCVLPQRELIGLVYNSEELHVSEFIEWIPHIGNNKLPFIAVRVKQTLCGGLQNDIEIGIKKTHCVFQLLCTLAQLYHMMAQEYYYSKGNSNCKSTTWQESAGGLR